MEEGVVMALRDVAEHAGLNWAELGEAMKRQGRLHLETY
jgi:benzoyl-CoA 2,3-dioxygenase component A